MQLLKYCVAIAICAHTIYNCTGEDEPNNHTGNVTTLEVVSNNDNDTLYHNREEENGKLKLRLPLPLALLKDKSATSKPNNSELASSPVWEPRPTQDDKPENSNTEKVTSHQPEEIPNTSPAANDLTENYNQGNDDEATSSGTTEQTTSSTIMTSTTTTTTQRSMDLSETSTIPTMQPSPPSLPEDLTPESALEQEEPLNNQPPAPETIGAPPSFPERPQLYPGNSGQYQKPSYPSYPNNNNNYPYPSNNYPYPSNNYPYPSNNYPYPSSNIHHAPPPNPINQRYALVDLLSLLASTSTSDLNQPEQQQLISSFESMSVEDFSKLIGQHQETPALPVVIAPGSQIALSPFSFAGGNASAETTMTSGEILLPVDSHDGNSTWPLQFLMVPNLKLQVIPSSPENATDDINKQRKTRNEENQLGFEMADGIYTRDRDYEIGQEQELSSEEGVVGDMFFFFRSGKGWNFSENGKENEDASIEYEYDELPQQVLPYTRFEPEQFLERVHFLPSSSDESKNITELQNVTYLTFEINGSIENVEGNNTKIVHVQ